MEKCKEVIKRKLTEWPFYKLMFTSILNNSFVQTLIFIIIGIIILFFANGENKEIINTIGVTIISVSLFKFLLSANAFTKVISQVIKESFLDLEFIKDYKTIKLFQILDSVSSEILDRNYKEIKPSIKNEIFNILGEQNGYYRSLSVHYEDTIKNGITESINKLTCENFSRFDEDYIARFTLKKTSLDVDTMFNLVKVQINDKDILVDVKQRKEEFKENGIEFVRFIYEFPLKAGLSKIHIESHLKDSETEHAFFMKKTCSNVKVSYKCDDTIIEPVVITKYGELDKIKSSSLTDNNISFDYGDKLFFKSEFIFIKFRSKEC